MLWKRNATGALRLSVMWICVSGLMILLMSDASASSMKPKQPARPPESVTAGPIDPAYELILMDRIDALTVDLQACRKMLALKEEKPECDSGFPWRWVIGAVVVGYVVNDVVD